MSHRIPLFKIHTPLNIGAVLERDVFDLGVLTEGVWADKFENEMSAWSGSDKNVLVNSCTAALTLAYKMAGVGPGTEVISTPMTCMATNEPIDTLGGTIVWADIDPTTGNIDPNDIEQLVTDKTVAISAVHWAGTPYQMKDVHDIALRHGLYVIDDAAHAIGATYRDSRIGDGTYSDFTCFSFQAIKHLTTGDGGMLTCRSDTDADRARKLRWFGLSRNYDGPKWEQDIVESGYKFHMNNINARIGLAQLPHLSQIVSQHRKHAAEYNAHINNRFVQKLQVFDDAVSSYWIYTLLVEDRDMFKRHMDQHGIDVDVVHMRNDRYSVFQKFNRRTLPGCDDFCARMINIPVGWWLSDHDVKRVIDAVNSYIRT